VTLVGNDSGGALCQLVITRHPERVARVVLTTCQAFELFPPSLFVYLRWAARVPPLLIVLAATMRLFPSLRRLPIAFGRLAKHRLPDALLDAWTGAAWRDRGVRRDVSKFLRQQSPRWTLAAAEQLREFRGRALVLWTPENRVLPLALGERLAAVLPRARLALIPDAWVYVAKDQPDTVARHIDEFLRESN
jgi:pimeloyl-ACP methyl ester carboxylesterase